MKHLLSALAVMMAVGTVPAIAADVGVSVQVGEPGFYGRIDVGNFPQPQVIYPRPTVIQPVPWRGAPADLPTRTPRPREALGQALPRVQRLWPAGLLRAGSLVQRAVRAALS